MNNKVIIRKARVGDEYEICRIQTEGWHDNNLSPETGVTKDYLNKNRKMSLPPSKEKVDEIKSRLVDDAKNNYLVAEHDGKVIGWIAGALEESGTFSFGLYVDRKNRNAGIGSLLMRQLFEIAKPKNISVEVTETNLRGIKFYERFGLKIMDKKKHYFDENIDIYLPVVIMQNFGRELFTDNC